MSKVIAVTIQKGGVGKSTTTHEIGSNLASMGHRVLLVDLDPQQNLSRMVGGDFDTVTIYDVLKGDVAIEDAIQSHTLCDLVISDKLLKWADRDFSGENDVYRLAAVLLDVQDRYSFIVVDTPPSLGVLPSMALCAANYCPIPCEATSNGMQGMGQLYESIMEIREEHNEDLQILGIVLTQYTWRTIFNREMKGQFEAHAHEMQTKVFETYIRSSVAVQEAQGFSQSLVEYAPKSKPAQDYKSLVNEILKMVQCNKTKETGR